MKIITVIVSFFIAAFITAKVAGLFGANDVDFGAMNVIIAIVVFLGSLYLSIFIIEKIFKKN